MSQPLHPSAPTIGISSWALHRTLGEPAFFGVEAGFAEPSANLKPGALPLLDLPSELIVRGFDILQICHFHLASLGHTYLDELRGEIKGAGVTLRTLLIDDGDLTHPDLAARDLDWIAGWFPIAARLGAREVRILAGKSGGLEAVGQSVERLLSLVKYAGEFGLRVTTENWFSVLSTPAAVKELVDACAGQVGLQLDFGNWSGPSKYDDLAAIAPFASICHAKAEFLNARQLDDEDFGRCLDLPYPEHFEGPFVLVSGGAGPHDWDGINLSRDFIVEHLGAAS
jgi:hypothetical protein